MNDVLIIFYKIILYVDKDVFKIEQSKTYSTNFIYM
jgi:hypothetical protein